MYTAIKYLFKNSWRMKMYTAIKYLALVNIIINAVSVIVFKDYGKFTAICGWVTAYIGYSELERIKNG